MGEDGPGPLQRGPTNLAEVFGGDSVVIPAGQLVHKSQHLVLGPDELRLDGAAWSTQEKTGSRAVSHPAASQARVPTARPQPPPLTPDSLDFVLGVGFAPAALHLRRVQQGMLPDGVGPIAGERVHHLWAGGVRVSMPTVHQQTPPSPRLDTAPTGLLCAEHCHSPTQSGHPRMWVWLSTLGVVAGMLRLSAVKLHTARSEVAELG